MTVDELRAEAEKLGYHVVKTRKRKNPNIGVKKCKDCTWLDMNEKCSIGYVCKNPNKRFRTRTAHFKYGHTPCCSLFADRGNKE